MHKLLTIKWKEWLPLNNSILNSTSYKKTSIFKINILNKKCLNCNKKSKLPYQSKYLKWKNIKSTKISQSSKINPINLQGRTTNLFNLENLTWQKKKNSNKKSLESKNKSRNSIIKKVVLKRWKMFQIF